MADIQRIYRLLVDAGQATRQLRNISGQMTKFGQGMDALGKKLKGAIGGLVAGFTVHRFTSELNNAISEMDRFTKEAQRIGIASDELVKLSYASELSGVSAEQLSVGIKTLSRSMADLAAGKSGDAVETFKDLDIEVQNADRSLRDTTDIIYDVADAFQDMPDGAAKSSAAMRIFGESGAQLIPLLNQGSEGIKAMGDEAEALGLIFDEKAGKQAEEFNDNMTRLKKAIDGAFLGIAQGLLPTIIDLTEELVTAAKKGGNFKQVGEDIGKVIVITGAAVGIASAVFKNGIAYIVAYGKALGTLIAAVTTLDFSNLGSALGDIFNELAGSVTENNKKIIADWKDLSAAIQGVWVATITDNTKATKKGLDDQKEILNSWKIEWNNTVKDLREVVAGFSSNVTDAITDIVLHGKRSFSDLADSFAEAITRMLIQKRLIDPLFKEIDTFLEGLEFNAHGNVYGRQGLMPFAHGGIVTSPTLFPFANGIGLMGEAGPEAILPLSRDANGDLGVKGSSTQVNVYNNSGATASVQKSTAADGGQRIDIMIENAVEKAIANGRFDKSLNSVYSLRRRGN